MQRRKVLVVCQIFDQADADEEDRFCQLLPVNKADHYAVGASGAIPKVIWTFVTGSIRSGHLERLLRRFTKSAHVFEHFYPHSTFCGTDQETVKNMCAVGNCAARPRNDDRF